MKCMNRNVLYSVGAVGVAVFFFAPSARHFLPLLASLACPLSMAGMMFSASKLGKDKPASSRATPQIYGHRARRLATPKRTTGSPAPAADNTAN